MSIRAERRTQRDCPIYEQPKAKIQLAVIAPHSATNMTRTANTRFEILPAGEMRAKYGLTTENRPWIRLDPRKVPESLRSLVSLAELFGISDDLIRADVFAKIPPGELTAMRAVVAAHDDVLDEWLAGPEADEPEFSNEYIAFSCLRMATDES